MEISYKKDGSRSFMIVRDYEVDENNFKLQMVLNNNIQGIVPMSIREVNNLKEIHYSTSSMISMENMYAQKKMSGDELYALIMGTQRMSENMREYLLDINHIIFEMEFVYIERKNGEYKFCYLPQKTKDFQNNIKNFFEKILEYIDYQDKKAVLMAYGVQSITISSNFTIQDIMNCAKEKVAEENNSEHQEQKKIGNTEQICEEDVVEKETKKKSILQSIVATFKWRNGRYKDEKQLTSEGIANIILREMNAEEPIEILPLYFPYVIGKSRKNSDFHINNSAVSRAHMRITKTEKGYVVEDLNSTNGTFVNGIRLESYEQKEINIGDRIRLADMDFFVEGDKIK